MPPRSILDALIREPADVYHGRSAEHVTSHSLADFRRCPLLYHRKQQGLIPERDSTAFLVGRAAHVLVLEGRARYEAEFAVGGPVNPKTGQPFGSNTKAFAEWAERIGKPALSDDQAALVEQMAASVKAHVFARELLAQGVAEGVVRCEVIGLACQARLDWINPLDGRGIVDLDCLAVPRGVTDAVSMRCQTPDQHPNPAPGHPDRPPNPHFGHAVVGDSADLAAGAHSSCPRATSTSCSAMSPQLWRA